ncbi:hypothetical protein FO519_010212, partial [Halicephalobus sp. NKZ332]
MRRLFGDNEGKVTATGIGGPFDRYLYVILGHLFISLSSAYSIIIFCSWKIYKFMKIHKNSILEIDIQKQLTKTLIVQAIIPLLTCCVPVFIMMIAPLLPIMIPEFVFVLLGLVLTYIPLGNGLSMLLYVSVYRTFVMNLLREGCRYLFDRYISTTVNPLE